MRLSPSDKVFCNSPWYELHIYWDGSLAFCCHASPALPYPVAERTQYNIKNMTIAEWYRSKPMQSARQRMFSKDRWDHCQACWYEESVNNTSRRYRSNQKSVIFTKENFYESFEQSPGYEKFTSPDYQGLPIDLHIDLGNYCNLACKMCTPAASSRIASQHRQWKLSTDVAVDWTQDDIVWKRFLNELVSLPKLQNIHFMGGETLIQPRFEELVDFLIARNQTSVCLSFVTNGTVYNEGLIQKLKQFSRVGLEVSIETLSDTNNYIRQGTDTDQVLKNIQRYQQECNGTSITLTLRPAPGLLSARDYWQVIKLALDQQLLIKSNIVTNPSFLAIEALPLSIRAGYIEPYTKLIADYNLDSVSLSQDYNESDPNNYRATARQQIAQIIAMLELPNPNNQKLLLTQLCQHLQAWDGVFGFDARIVYPELNALLTSYGYCV